MSVISDIKMILDSNKYYLLHDAKNYFEQIGRWNAIKDADVVEVKHGRWIKDKYGVRRCSVCEDCYQDVGYGWNYCPNCGADMRSEE